MDERPSYAMVPAELYDIARELPEESRMALLMACCAYALDGIEPDLEGLELAVFNATARKAIDRGLANMRQRRANGRRHTSKGKPESNRTATESEPETNRKPTETEPESNRDGTGDEPETNREPSEQGELLGLGIGIDPPSPNGEEGGSKGGGAPRTPRPARRFVPPTEDEARSYGDEYAQGRGYPPGSFDADRFMAFYESKDWKVGRSPMRDWRAAVRNSVLDEWAIAKGRASPARRPSAAASAAAGKTETVTEI